MMKLFFKPGEALLFWLCSGMLMLSACTTTLHSERSIEKRATERWDALLSGDLMGAYEFLSPGYRSSVSVNRYQRSVLTSKVQWTGAKYFESECAETICKVTIFLDYTLHGALPGVGSFSGTQIVEESWVLADGDWHFVPKD